MMPHRSQIHFLQFGNTRLPASYVWQGIAVVVTAIAAIGWSGENASAQLVTDLQVEVTEVDGLFRYDYTVSNDILSGFGLNAFVLTLGRGANVQILEQPQGWEGEYASAELNYQVGWVSSAEAEIGPGLLGRFALTSNYGPGSQNYFVAKLVEGEIIDSIFSTILAPTQSQVIFATCDFNQDGSCNLADIDALGLQIAMDTGNQLYDLTGDDLVKQDDLDAFLAHPQVNKVAGDLDFNGKVEFADFLNLSANFGSLESKRWSNGDLVPNFEVTFADFLVLSSNYGKSSPAGGELAALPEPNPLFWIGYVLGGLASVVRRRRASQSAPSSVLH